MRRVIIMGAAGRDFHDFNMVFRDGDTHRMVAFTATQIPGIDGRVYPASLAGQLHPDGIPIRPQKAGPPRLQRRIPHLRHRHIAIGGASAPKGAVGRARYVLLP